MGERSEIIYGDGFWKDFDALPKEAQEKLDELFEVLAENVFDPRLHTKPLGPPLTGRYTFRITRDWRVAFRFGGNRIIKILVADHRSNIYKRLKRAL